MCVNSLTSNSREKIKREQKLFAAFPVICQRFTERNSVPTFCFSPAQHTRTLFSISRRMSWLTIRVPKKIFLPANVSASRGGYWHKTQNPRWDWYNVKSPFLISSCSSGVLYTHTRYTILRELLLLQKWSIVIFALFFFLLHRVSFFASASFLFLPTWKRSKKDFNQCFLIIRANHRHFSTQWWPWTGQRQRRAGRGKGQFFPSDLAAAHSQWSEWEWTFFFYYNFMLHCQTTATQNTGQLHALFSSRPLPASLSSLTPQLSRESPATTVIVLLFWCDAMFFSSANKSLWYFMRFFSAAASPAIVLHSSSRSLLPEQLSSNKIINYFYYCN